MSAKEHSTSSESLEEKCPRKCDPDHYEPSGHFQQQYKWRNMDGDWIPELITSGELRKSEDDPTEYDPHPDKYHFVKEIFCEEWHLIVQYKESGPNTIKTAYVPGFEKEDYDRCFGGN